MFFASSTQKNILIRKYVNEQNNVKHEYVNLYHWELDLSRPDITDFEICGFHKNTKI